MNFNFRLHNFNFEIFSQNYVDQISLNSVFFSFFDIQSGDTLGKSSLSVLISSAKLLLFFFSYWQNGINPDSRMHIQMWVFYSLVHCNFVRLCVCFFFSLIFIIALKMNIEHLWINLFTIDRRAKFICFHVFIFFLNSSQK